MRKTRRDGGADRGGEGRSERRYESESVQNRAYKRGGRGQVSGREREGEEEGQFETEVVFEFRGQGCRVGVFSTLTEEQHYYSLWWQPALTQLVK